MSDDSHSLRLHSIGLASSQPLGSMCARGFCVPKFEVGGPLKEMLETMCGIFFTIEIPPDPALSAILFASIASVSRHRSR